MTWPADDKTTYQLYVQQVASGMRALNKENPNEQVEKKYDELLKGVNDPGMGAGTRWGARTAWDGITNETRTRAKSVLQTYNLGLPEPGDAAGSWKPR